MLAHPLGSNASRLVYRLLQQILASFEKPTPAPPDVQPSQAALEHSLPEQPLYEQRYQEQAPGQTNKMLKEDQPQAQYPEQLPPMG